MGAEKPKKDLVSSVNFKNLAFKLLFKCSDALVPLLNFVNIVLFLSYSFSLSACDFCHLSLPFFFFMKNNTNNSDVYIFF